MKSKSFLTVSILALSPLFVAIETRAAAIYCPKVIIETPAVSTVDKEWTVSAISGERLVEHVGIYVGSPSEYGSQVPDSTQTIRKNEETVTWTMPAARTEIFWVGCSYIGTTAILFKKLDPGITVCVARYALLPTGRRQRLNGMDCR